jgi:hypothetical protein
MFQVQSAGFDGALHLQESQRLVQRDAEPAVPSHSAQRQDIQQGWRWPLPGIQIEGVDAEDK